MDEKDIECLRDLFPVDPQDDIETIEMNKDKLLYEAYKWILDTKGVYSIQLIGAITNRRYHHVNCYRSNIMLVRARQCS